MNTDWAPNGGDGIRQEIRELQCSLSSVCIFLQQLQQFCHFRWVIARHRCGFYRYFLVAKAINNTVKTEKYRRFWIARDSLGFDAVKAGSPTNRWNYCWEWNCSIIRARSSDECASQYGKMTERINALDSVEILVKTIAWRLYILFAVRHLPHNAHCCFRLWLVMTALRCFCHHEINRFFSHMFIFIRLYLSSVPRSLVPTEYWQWVPSTWDNNAWFAHCSCHSVNFGVQCFFFSFSRLCSHPLRLAQNQWQREILVPIGEHWTRKRMHESVAWMEKNEQEITTTAKNVSSAQG